MSRISKKDKWVFSLLVVFILVFSAFTVGYSYQGKDLNLSLNIENEVRISQIKNNFDFGVIREKGFEILSNQKQCNYTVPITFNSTLHHLRKGYIYQQLIQLNRSRIPEINSKFSNLYFSYGNGSIIYAWIMNVTGNIANIWLKLSFQAILTIYLNIGPMDLSLFGSSTCLGYKNYFFNAPLVFGNSTSPHAWDFSGTSLPNGFINSGTTYTVNNGLYISGETIHYGTIYIPGIYDNNTGIISDMQISSNGHSRLSQSFYYVEKGVRKHSFNFWYLVQGKFSFASEGRGPTNNSEISNYGYNIIGINDNLDKNIVCGTFDNLTFLDANTDISDSSHFTDYTYYIGDAYDEQYSNYSWVVIRTTPPNNIYPQYSIGKIHKTYSVIFRSGNLPIGSDWYINVTGNQTKETFFVTQSQFTINLQNGGYSYEVGNSTSYYPVSYGGHFNLSSNAIIITVKFDRFAFLRVLVTPWFSSVMLNGKRAFVSEWVYDENGLLHSAIYCISILPGNYTINVEENHYRTYSENVSLSSGKLLSLNITLSPKTTGVNYSYLAVFIIIAVVSFSSILYLSKRGRK